MGWNTYFGVGGIYDERTIKEIADTLVDSGLAAGGYRIVWLDYGWASGARGVDGELIIDPGQWPTGMKGLADYLHSRGLWAGTYSDAGPTGGQGKGVGSMGHYQQDADTLASWGFDAIKIDFVGGGQKRLDPVGPMTEFATALRNNASRRPMIINICNFWMPGHLGDGYPPYERSSHYAWAWAPAIGDSWRTETDIGFTNNVVFRDVLRSIDANSRHPEVQRPGKWNDPDYLTPEIGMTDEEARAQMSMWAIMGAPLVIGSDVRKLSVRSIEMLSNAAVIAIDQDPLGIQGRRVRSRAGREVWVKPLAAGDHAVALLNRTSVSSRIPITPSDLGVTRGRRYAMTNVWSGATKSLRRFRAPNVPARGAALYRVAVAEDAQTQRDS
jgi:alpha-galactosidase